MYIFSYVDLELWNKGIYSIHFHLQIQCWKNTHWCTFHIYIYIYIKWTVFVNITTESAQHAHALMIAIIFIYIDTFYMYISVWSFNTKCKIDAFYMYFSVWLFNTVYGNRFMLYVFNWMLYEFKEHNDMTYNASNYNICIIIWFIFYHAIMFFI